MLPEWPGSFKECIDLAEAEYVAKFKLQPLADWE